MNISKTIPTHQLAEYTVIKGDNEPHSVAALKEFGENLFDVAMYSATREETYCVFSIGKNTNKFVCCKLETDNMYESWLGFTPIKNYQVPYIIKQDLIKNFTTL